MTISGTGPLKTPDNNEDKNNHSLHLRSAYYAPSLLGSPGSLAPGPGCENPGRLALEPGKPRVNVPGSFVVHTSGVSILWVSFLGLFILGKCLVPETVPQARDTETHKPQMEPSGSMQCRWSAALKPAQHRRLGPTAGGRGCPAHAHCGASSGNSAVTPGPPSCITGTAQSPLLSRDNLG